MRLLTPILLTGLLLTVSVAAEHSNGSRLQHSSLASLPTLSNTQQLIVRRGHPGHRGSGRIESHLGIARSLA